MGESNRIENQVKALQFIYINVYVCVPYIASWMQDAGEVRIEGITTDLTDTRISERSDLKLNTSIIQINQK